MYRTLYDKNTGKILICRKISDKILSEQLALNPEQACIDGYTDDINNKKVDLETLQIVDKPTVVNHTGYTRRKRDLLLMECDWTQAVDSPLSAEKRAEWATYRDTLRNIPQVYDIVNTPPEQIVWPSKPE